jgi:hypothetical protein
LLPLENRPGMFEEYENKRRRQIALMRSLLDFGIGILIFLAGIFLFVRDRFVLEFNEKFPPNKWDKIFGIVCVAYGLWRIYRGYKKNYFK